MIQLPVIGTNIVNTPNVQTTKEVGKPNFEELLQLMSVSEKENEEATELFADMNPLLQPVLTQIPAITANKEVPSQNSQEPSFPIKTQVVNEFVLSGVNEQPFADKTSVQIKQPLSSPEAINLNSINIHRIDEQLISPTIQNESTFRLVGIDAANEIVYTEEQGKTLTVLTNSSNSDIDIVASNDDKVNTSPLFTDTSKSMVESEDPNEDQIGDDVKSTTLLPESNNNEAPESNLLNRNIAPEEYLISKSTVITDAPAEQTVYAEPVRSTELEKGVASFLQSSFQVKSEQDGMEATFYLHPAHLGKVDVKVSILDGNVTAEFFASSALGKDLLETNVQALRSALEQQGFQVDKIDISHQQNDTLTNSFSQKGYSNSRQGQQNPRKQNERILHNHIEDYQDSPSESGWSSQINTTA